MNQEMKPPSLTQQLTQKHRRRLGTTGLDVSPLALGTVKLGRNSQIKYPAQFDLPDDRAVVELLSLAADCGINLLDTAPAYGSSEARIGRLLPGQRQDWILSTKAGEFFDQGISRFDFSRPALERSVRQSLKNLRTDYLDILLVHADDSDEHIIGHTDALETLARLKDKGMIRNIGLSAKTVPGAMLALPEVDVLMVTFNAEDRSSLPVIERAGKLGVGILLKKVLASGHSQDPAGHLAAALSLPGVHSVVMGTLDPLHLRDNVRAALISLDDRVVPDRVVPDRVPGPIDP